MAPNVVPRNTAEKATIRVVRAPNMILLRTSRPKESVPHRFTESGGEFKCWKLVYCGSKGAIKGAAMATMTTATKNKPEATPKGFWLAKTAAWCLNCFIRPETARVNSSTTIGACCSGFTLVVSQPVI